MELVIVKTENCYWTNELSAAISALTESYCLPNLDIYIQDSERKVNIVSENKLTKEGIAYLDKSGITDSIEKGLAKLRDAIANSNLD